MENNDIEIKMIETLSHEFKVVRKLGRGGFGLVYEVKNNGKSYAAKLIERKKYEKENEAEIIKEFRGQNIVKINKVFEMSKDKNLYYIIIMEKAPLKNLYECIKDLNNNNSLNLIYLPFEIMGNNLLKFFIFQLIQGLEILNRNNFCHFDIKPENVLIFNGYYVKWSDFGLLRDVDTLIKNDNNNNNDKEISIPGGTVGYFSPEFYQNNYKLFLEHVYKHDYFALGVTVYFIKYAKKLLEMENNKDNNDPLMTANDIIDQLEKKIDEIKSDKSSHKDFANFLCSLIHYKPEERADLESLLRNKWINENKKEIEKINEINKLDEPKILMEINKSDFLIKKKNYLDKIKSRSDKFVFKKKLGKLVL